VEQWLGVRRRWCVAEHGSWCGCSCHGSSWLHVLRRHRLRAAASCGRPQPWRSSVRRWRPCCHSWSSGRRRWARWGTGCWGVCCRAPACLAHSDSRRQHPCLLLQRTTPARCGLACACTGRGGVGRAQGGAAAAAGGAVAARRGTRSSSQGGRRTGGMVMLLGMEGLRGSVCQVRSVGLQLSIHGRVGIHRRRGWRLARRRPSGLRRRQLSWQQGRRGLQHSSRCVATRH
jgi:hypothetical protein